MSRRWPETDHAGDTHGTRVHFDGVRTRRRNPGRVYLPGEGSLRAARLERAACRHRYFFKVYALDVVLPDLGQPDKARLERAMKGHVLAQQQIVGTYAKR